MPCVGSAALTICYPPRGVVCRRIIHCPVCEQRRRFVVQHLGIWYPLAITCCGCGDRWSDGELMERPFQRGWRKRSIAKARAMWAMAMTRAAFEAAVRDELDAELGSAVAS